MDQELQLQVERGQNSILTISSRFNNPIDVALDPISNMYVAVIDTIIVYNFLNMMN